MKVYIAPSKALVQEKLRDWNEKFGPWGITCLELTGDNEFYNARNIHEADIILTTPEVSMHSHFAWTYKLQCTHSACLLKKKLCTSADLTRQSCMHLYILTIKRKYIDLHI